MFDSVENGTDASPPAELEGENGATAANDAPGEATSGDWAERCASCHAALHGAYCHACGEKVVGPADYALAGFLRRVLSTLTHLDGSVFRTYYYLVARPGFLTQEHRAGRRKRYLRPLQVFVVVNVVFYLFSVMTGANMLQTQLGAHLYGGSSFFHAGIAERLVTAHVEAEGITLRAYAEQFGAWIAPLSKTLVIAMLPVFALLLKALHPVRRRYYVEHLVFACHALAFWLLLAMVLGVLVQGLLPLSLYAALGSVPSVLGNGLVLSWAMLLAVGAYFYKALRRRYGQSVGVSMAKAAALSLGVVLVLMLYRALLFFIAFYATT